MSQNRRTIYLAGFLYSVPISLAYFINSSFISSFVGEKSVGFIFASGSAISIFALLVFPKIFRKIGSYKFLLLVTFFDALSFLALSFLKNSWSIIATFILLMSLNTLIVFSLDEILKIFSKDSATGKIRGIYIMLDNITLILAEVSYGTILVGFSFREIYLISFFFMLLFLAIALVGLKETPDPSYDKAKTFKYVKDFFENENLTRAFGITFLLQFFYCLMAIYTPIYLYTHLGFSWKEIGIIFAIMLLPFAFIPPQIGKYGDRIKERKILIFGFTLTSLATVMLFFIREHSLWIWALALFATRVGASSIEVMADSYFFKHIKSENEELIGVYRSAAPVAYIVCPLLVSLFLIVTPSFNFIFPILGALMLFGVYLSSTIKISDI